MAVTATSAERRTTKTAATARPLAQFDIPALERDGEEGRQAPDLISRHLDRRAISEQLSHQFHGSLALPSLLDLLVKFLPV